MQSNREVEAPVFWEALSQESRGGSTDWLKHLSGLSQGSPHPSSSVFVDEKGRESSSLVRNHAHELSGS